MKVKGLDGRLHSWNLVGYVPLGDDEVKRSAPHKKARSILTEIFPRDRLLEEVPLPGSGGLTADFYIPSYKLMIEVHGEQHYQESTLFHKNYLDFVKGQKRDSRKRKWCEINDITLVELPFNENIEDWKSRILNE
jgi:hypothetical protein